MTSVQNKAFVYYFGGQFDRYLRNNKLMRPMKKWVIIIIIITC